jgi:hypothetical protein
MKHGQPRTTPIALGAAGALGFGALAARGPAGANGALWAVSMAVAASSVARFGLFAARTSRAGAPRVNQSERRQSGSPLDIGIVIVANGYGLRPLRAAVLAARAVHGVDGLRLAAVAQDEDADVVGVEFGVTVLRGVTPAAAIDAAMNDLRTEFVAVFDGQEAVFPDLAGQIGRHFDAPDVALVRCAIAEGSALTGLARAVAAGDGAAGTALPTDTCWVARRSMIVDVGGVAADRDGGMFTTAALLHHRGLRTVFHATPVAAGHGAPNLQSQLAAAGRRCGLLVRAALRPGGPLLSRHHPLVSRVAFLDELLEVASGGVAAAASLGTAAVLFTGHLPVSGPPIVIAAIAAAWFGGTALARRKVGGPGGAVGRLGHDTVKLMGVQIRAAARALIGQVSSSEATSAIEHGGVTALSRLRLATGLTGVLSAGVIARLLAGAIGGLLPAMSASASVGSLIVASVLVAQLASALRLLMKQRQRRVTPRLPVTMAARLGEHMVQVLDLTPDGVGFLATESLEHGQFIDLVLAMPQLDGSASMIQAVGTVASCASRSDKTFRVGMRIDDVEASDPDALLEYCTYMHPFFLSRGRMTAATHVPSITTARRAKGQAGRQLLPTVHAPV